MLKKTIPARSSDEKKKTSRGKKSNDAEQEIEFVCKVFFYFNAEKKMQQYCILIESTQLFMMMNYELSVEMDTKDKDININILGINTRGSILSEINPATAQLFCDELSGKYTINVIKQDGNINCAIFDFNLPLKEITLINEFLPEKINNRKFCSFKVASENNTFS